MNMCFDIVCVCKGGNPTRGLEQLGHTSSSPQSPRQGVEGGETTLRFTKDKTNPDDPLENRCDAEFILTYKCFTVSGEVFSMTSKALVPASAA